MANWLGHLKTVHHHRALVRKHCFRVGLYWQGLTHDLSKYAPVEWIPGVKYYQGNRSPNEAERAAKGYSSAWLHHKGRNRHHLEYLIHPHTKALLEALLARLRDEGEDAVFAYIKKEILKK